MLRSLDECVLLWRILYNNNGSFPDIRLVACTVLTASKHPLIDTIDVDCCIMDEAGQIPQPAALGALLKTKRLRNFADLSAISTFIIMI
jgi:superfamily I DNA and/or RNA helicase